MWVNWGEIFRVSSYWANLEMINFWAPTPPGRGPLMGQNFFVNDLAMGDIAAVSRATKFSTITYQVQGKISQVSNLYLAPKAGPPLPEIFSYTQFLHSSHYSYCYYTWHSAVPWSERRIIRPSP